ncbi:Integrase [uncultured delta proteobacterium]|uniref:Integrase n=1 Tax=uncultured delta proteobacterium TaxID=34034 RepID=A0A212JTN7_9DELT|nr:Integrase [uncultured delta proteobacterium]
MKLTDSFLRGLKGNGTVRKFSDGGGLYIHVSGIGGRLWRMGYRFGGKQKTLSFGTYPAVSLKAARRRREETKELLAAGIDPGEHKKALKAAAWAEAANSFEVVAREWYSLRKGSWAAAHAENVINRLEKHIFPPIGSSPVNRISAPELLQALRRIEASGAVDAAHRALQNCSQIFRYAISTGRSERDPAADLKGALSPFRSTSFATITDPHAIGILLRDIDAYSGNAVVRASLRMAPYVFVRPGELRRAEWAEFNLADGEWRIPASRMKMRIQHIVPLARQVREILEDLYKFTGKSRFLFPSMRANNAPISDMTLLAGLRRMGYDKVAMTMHGFRSMASTLLNEQGYNRDWIERQLAHGERNSIRAAYNYAEYLPERRRMMQEWADYLDALRQGRADAAATGLWRYPQPRTQR